MRLAAVCGRFPFFLLRSKVIATKSWSLWACAILKWKLKTKPLFMNQFAFDLNAANEASLTSHAAHHKLPSAVTHANPLATQPKRRMLRHCRNPVFLHSALIAEAQGELGRLECRSTPHSVGVPIAFHNRRTCSYMSALCNSELETFFRITGSTGREVSGGATVRVSPLSSDFV